MILFESLSKIQEQIEQYLKENDCTHWDTSTLVKTIISQYSIVDIDQDIKSFTEAYESAISTLIQDSDSEQKINEASRRKLAIKQIMESPHIRSLFLAQFGDDLDANALTTVVTRAENNAGSSKAQRKQSGGSRDNQQQQQEEGQPRPYHFRSCEKKKFKEIQIPKNISPEDAMQLIVKSKNCKDSIVDFTKPVSRRFRPYIPSIIEHYHFNLQSSITLEERRILMDFSLCKSTKDEDLLLQDLFRPRSNMTENVKYLRTAINGLFDAWRSNRLQKVNDEGRLRSNLYSFIWDRAFLFDSTFYAKRAECYSAVIRKLKEQDADLSQQRIDFILRSNHDGMDYLSLEEKPTDKHAIYDFDKGKKMQQHMLQLWSKWLGSNRLVAELEAITCQFEERKITVFATRMLSSGHFIVYKKATAYISASANHYASAARVLQVVLSVKRLVTLNYMKLMAMIETIEYHATKKLDLNISTDVPFISYTNSTDSLDSNSDNNENVSETIEPEYVEEALMKAKTIRHPDAIVSVGDWEKILIDDVNRALSKKRQTDNSINNSTATNKKQRT